MTHGAISRQVQAFEAWVGLEVFQRLGRRVRLTDVGRSYLATVQAAFDSISGATERLVQTSRARSLTINALPTFTVRWLLPRLTKFQLRFPAVELRLLTSSSAVPGGSDFDVAIRRGAVVTPGFKCQEFLAENELPICSPSLLLRLPLRTPADLAQHTLLHADTRPGAWPRWLAAAGVPDLISAGRQQFDHFNLALQAAADGLGVALGPLPLLEEEFDAGRLVAPLAGPTVPSQSYFWVVPERLAAEPIVAAFCSWLSEGGAAAGPKPPP